MRSSAIQCVYTATDKLITALLQIVEAHCVLYGAIVLCTALLCCAAPLSCWLYCIYRAARYVPHCTVLYCTVTPCRTVLYRVLLYYSTQASAGTWPCASHRTNELRHIVTSIITRTSQLEHLNSNVYRNSNISTSGGRSGCSRS